MNPQLTWNLITDVQQMWAYPFMVTALRAGTVVAVLAGVVGWVMVLRKESFAGHTLAVVGFQRARSCSIQVSTCSLVTTATSVIPKLSARKAWSCRADSP